MKNLRLLLIFYNSVLVLKVCERSVSPQWSEAFYFPVIDPKEEILIMKVNEIK